MKTRTFWFMQKAKNKKQTKAQKTGQDVRAGF